MANKIRRGDKVIVRSGSNKGQIGIVESVQDGMARVQGVNLQVKHVKPRSGEKGRQETINGPLHTCKLAHVDENGKPIKVGFAFDAQGKKFLVDKKNPERRIRSV